MDEGAFLVELSTIYPGDRLLTKQAQLVTYESDALNLKSRLSPGGVGRASLAVLSRSLVVS